MAIGNLKNKVSSDDVDRIKSKRNPPEYESGFEPNSIDNDDVDFSDIFGDTGGFDSLDDTFGKSDDSFGSVFGGGGSFNDGFGSDGGFGDSAFGGGAFGGGAFGGGAFGQQPKAEEKRDKLDDIMDASIDSMSSIGKIIVDIFKSTKTRNADDYAYYSRNIIITGLSMCGASVVLSILGGIGGIKVLKLFSLPWQVISGGMLLVGTGLSGMGFSAISILNTPTDSSDINKLSDISEMDNSDTTEIYEDNVDDIMSDLFGDMEDDEDDFGSFGGNSTSNNNDAFKSSFDDFSFEDIEEDKEPENKVVNYEEKLENIGENRYLTREILFNTFKDFFPTNTPNFAEKTDIDVDSDTFSTLETMSLKALANVARCELEDLNSRLESATETYFSYELRLKRVRGVTKLDDIAREIEAYFRESSTDTSVVATVDIEGDFYKIVVTKGEKAVITFGDVFRQKSVSDFFLDKKNRLPIITGVNQLGEIIAEDAKPFDTMLIAGKPRSGKSWYVLSILMSLMTFNSPEDVQFIIVDPKESTLFKTIGLMPHVAGVHNDSNILEIMRDIIDNEGARRKKLLSDNKCDDIWALWKKGIKLPILYLVIDEIITVKANLGKDLDKEFDSLMKVIISQLPSQGIRLLFVPHRATGVVDKTSRTMLSFTAAVRANNDDVKDTLGVAKWTHSLVNQGDVAIKSNSSENPFYVRGASITTSDEENTELIISIAKAFYKMGVDLPDMTMLRACYNRDEEYIRKELSTGNMRVQYNSSNIFDDI